MALMKNRECYETNFSGCCSLFLRVVKMVGCKYINIYTVGEWVRKFVPKKKTGSSVFDLATVFGLRAG